MTNWKAFTLASLAALSCGFAPAEAQPKAMSAYAALPPINKEYTTKVLGSLALAERGDASIKHLAWKEAKQEYQQALDLLPDSKPALYGLAKYSQNDGETAKAIEYYRKAIYSTNPADKGFGETNTSRLMEFALLLNKTGQIDEALSVYNHAATALDYQDSDTRNGEPHLKVLLPEIVRERVQADQVRYTPERLQASANTALAYEEMAFGSNKEALSHMQEAVKLYPDSPVTHYYLGEALPSGSPREKAAYKKASELGDGETKAAAKERLKVLR